MAEIHTHPESRASRDIKVSPKETFNYDEMPGESKVVEQIALDTINAEHEYTDAEYRRLRWKIDFWLLPLMWLCYGVQQADKTAVSVQAVFGLLEDTKLVGQQFSWLTTVFYLTYMISEGPANYIMQKFHIGRFLGICMFLWGVIVLCLAFAKDFASLMVLRSLQGVFESTISPSFLMLTGAWYTSNEHSLRSIIWGTANAGMSVITGLINYGIGQHAQRNPGGLAPWKGISFFLGALTIVLGVLSFFILGTPREVLWLSEREKRMAAARTVSNQTGSDRQKHDTWKWDQVVIAFKDPQTYFFFVTTVVNGIPVGGVITFVNLVYRSFGFSNLETLLIGTVPQQALSVLWFLLIGYVTYRWHNLRFYSMIACIIPAFTGLLGVALLPQGGNLWVKWGLYLMSVTGNLPGLLMWTLLPSNVAGRTKKSVTATVLFVAYCVGNAIGPQVFQAKDAPQYIPGLIVCATCFGAETGLIIAWRFYYVYQNRRRAQQIATLGLSPEEAAHRGKVNAEADMTDFENLHFVYQL